MYFEYLTDEGRAWAEAHAHESIVARVALAGYDSGWPSEYVDTATKVANAGGDAPGIGAQS